MDDQSLKQAALYYHENPTPGKISVTPSKQLVNQHDLALAYSPGVAAPCLEIERDPSTAAKYTARGNLVAVVTNGTAVLGLGNIGPLASKPVMEGKGVLFKKFAGVDVFDIEIAENDPDKIVDIVAALEPTFGGINLEDIKAPECFYIEKKLRERMNIPVFHDDQHGTSIIVGSALLNALQLVNKKIEDIKIVASGAGAAALSCLDLLCALGARKENIIVADSRGLLTTSRDGLDESKKRYVQDITATQLHEVITGADMFLGLSAAGILTKEMVKGMAENPIIFALANPDPEILPEHAHEVRPDVIMATGRSDYPNQVNNANIKKLGLRLENGVNIEIVDQENNPLYEEFWKDYYQIMQRKGVTVEYAQREARRRSTLIAAMLVKFGKADGMLCGTYSSYDIHLDFVSKVIGLKEGMNNFFTLNALMLEDRNLFIADTYVNTNPTAEQLADMTILAAEEVRRFGITPRVALLSHSSFGSNQEDPSAQKMREVYRLLNERAPELEVEGEMHGDAALDESIRHSAFPGSNFKGSANLLIMPNLDAANISFNLLKATSGNNVTIGPILLGAAKPVHILTPTATTRRVLNMTALTVAEIQQSEG